MTCQEFERVLPELEGRYTVEQDEHLRSCAACSELAWDLSTIAQQAELLQASEEPSPRVWNSIEIELQREGLIRPASKGTAFAPGWRLGWLVPLAAAFLVIFGVLVLERGGRPESAGRSAPDSAKIASVQASLNTPEDDQLLEAVQARTPRLRADFEANLQLVNAYIRDAEQSAKSDPNDEIAQQQLMNAYDERAMIYQMALNRSLP